MSLINTVTSSGRYIFNRLLDKKNNTRNYSGLDRISIKKIASPLRYDIIIRYNFFKFHIIHQSLFSNHFERYFDLAQNTDYFLWFKHIAYPIHRNILRDRSPLIDSFKKRVHKSVSLYNSFDSYGFDNSQPIVLHSGQNICKTSTGIQLSMKFFAGNGCHRIALLWLNGAEYIEADQYLVKEYKSLSPLDNTYLLLPFISLSKSEYFSYISSAYCNEIFNNKDDIFQSIKSNSPCKLVEFLAILNKDLPSIN